MSERGPSFTKAEGDEILRALHGARQRFAELEALYADSCSALIEHMAIHAQVVNRVRELEAEVARLRNALASIANCEHGR